ncbi:unnamed protein product [Ilex paraguariensis]|uniref:Uncharacterized protein n=1 Tax=Ilex paraguariensis TaxID=185542 RepID=A0ABC8T9K0_9AQUA
MQLTALRNFEPVEEIGGAIEVDCTDGKVPEDFPEGVYIRIGPNPRFGGPKSAVSIFGRTNHIWVEGEGMLHALYFKKNATGDWTLAYNNRQVVSETVKSEKERNKLAFIPAVDGDALGILAAYFFNLVMLSFPLDLA